jgi:flagellar basal-body rod modification protein FlgD
MTGIATVAPPPPVAGAPRSGGIGLGQDDFLTLLVAQLRNQDPLSPLNNEAFVAQLAQFATVSGITEMGRSLDALATGSRDLLTAQAGQLVGREATPADGLAATIVAVRFPADGGTLLDLADGRTVALSTLRALR